MHCMGCGAKIEEGDTFCPSCGTQIKYPEKVRESEKRSCPGCGMDINSNDPFCGYCGRKLEKIEVKKTPGEVYPHSFATILGYIFAILGGLVGIIFGIYLLTREDPRAKFHGKVVLILTVCMIIFWILLTIFISYLSYLGTFGGI